MYWPWGSCDRIAVVKSASHCSALPSPLSIAVKSCTRADPEPVTIRSHRGPVRAERTHLIVDVEAVEVVLLHPRRHGGGGRSGIRAGRRRLLGGAEARDHERDARGRVLGLDGRPLVGGDLLPLLCLIRGTARQQEGENTVCMSVVSICSAPLLYTVLDLQDIEALVQIGG